MNMTRYQWREQRRADLREKVRDQFRVVIRPGTLRQMLKMVQWQQKDLAEAIGVSPETVNRIANGRMPPRYKTLVDMTEALEKRLYELYGYTKEDIFNMLISPDRERERDADAVERTKKVKAAIETRLRRARR